MTLLTIFSVPDFVFFPEDESVYMYVWIVYQYVWTQNTKEKLALSDI